MKKKHVIITGIICLVVAGGIGAYAALDNYLGNQIEVQTVMGSSEASSLAAGNQGESIPLDHLNGKWDIAKGSKVYWSLTTSKEKVNFVNEAVTGSWTVNVQDPSAMAGEGVMDMTALNSGNEQRDTHVKEREDFLDVAKYPTATFTPKAFELQSNEWKEGIAVPLKMTGVLHVKGKDKEVTFNAEAMHKDGQLLLSGKTNITFADFGVATPDSVILETEKDITVQLELVLGQAK